MLQFKYLTLTLKCCVVHSALDYLPYFRAARTPPRNTGCPRQSVVGSIRLLSIAPNGRYKIRTRSKSILSDGVATPASVGKCPDSLG